MTDLKEVGLSSKAGLRFKFVSHDDVTDKLHDLFVKHGIDQEVSVLESSLLRDGVTIQLLVQVAWVNVDTPDDRKVVQSIGHSSTVNKSKDGGYAMPDDLGPGKALSYAVKMAQLKNFALVGEGGDLEEDSARTPGQPKQLASVEEVEAVMNELASAGQDQARFNLAAQRAAAIAERVTPEQRALLGKAWQAAKARLSEQPAHDPRNDEPEPNQPEVNPGKMHEETGGLDTATFNALVSDYSLVNSSETLAAIRKRITPLIASMRPAQKEVLKQCDASANNKLRIQQEVAGG